MADTGEWDALRPYLPEAWIAALERMTPDRRATVQEIRLRAGQPVTLSFPAGEGYLCRDGMTELWQRGVFRCDARTPEEVFFRLCEDSVYSHESELQQGYITAPGGLRVGVAGTAVCEDGQVRSLRQVTSLCIRLPRAHRGCAAGLLPLVMPENRVYSTLLVGEPSSGKTSLLRDLAEELSCRDVRVTVVDERGELAGVGGLPGCDVLRGYPKPAGIWQAIRCLAPQAVLFDELGTPEEIEAVIACAHAGVAAVSTLHGADPQSVAYRPAVQRLAQERMFRRWVFLAGRQTPGVWTRCWEPEAVRDEIHWHMVGGAGGDRPGVLLRPALVPTG